MRKLYLLLILVLFTTSNVLFAQEKGMGSRLKVGVNTGAIWQEADIRTKTGFGWGTTLEWNFLENNHSFFGLSMRGRFLHGNAYGRDIYSDNDLTQNVEVNGNLYSNIDYSGSSFSITTKRH